MIYHDIDQNSEQWQEVRRGKFTASTFADLFADKKTKTYQNAIIKVAYEIVTGESEESYSNKWMQRGHEREPLAAEQYELLTFTELETCGFYELNDFIGASPDRKIKGQNAGCEFKCPSFQVYNEYLETGKVAKNYYIQIQGQLMCTGWDYIDYMPFSSPRLKQLITRVERDDYLILEITERLETAIYEVQILVNKIKN